MANGKDTGLKGLRLIYNQLERSAREKKPKTELIPAKYARLSADDLYDQFLKVRPDAKGLMASGYGSSGWQLQLNFYMDFGNYWLPGVFKIPVDINLAGSVSDYAMLLIHRSMPRNLPAPPNADDGAVLNNGNDESGGAAAAVAPAPVAVQPLWTTTNPVCFMAMFGKSYTFKVDGKVSIFWYKEPSDLWSGKKELESGKENNKYVAFIELPYAISGGASLNAGYTYQTMKLVDRSPGWYDNGTAQGLRTDFLKVLGDKSKTVLKQDIIKWIARFSGGIYPFLYNYLWIEDKNTEVDLVKDFIDLQQKVLDKERQATPDHTLSNRIKKTLVNKTKGLLKTITLFEPVTYLTELAGAKSTSTDELLKTLTDLSQLMPKVNEITAYYNAKFPTPTPQQIADREAIEKGVKEMRDQIGVFKNRLLKIKTAEQAGERNKIPTKEGSIALGVKTKFLCYLKMASHAVDAELGINCEYGAGLFTPLGLKGQLKHTAYRYQTFATNAKLKPLIYTQDTHITYRQAKFKAANGFQWAGAEDEYAKPFLGKNMKVNAMSYRSVNAYWLYPYALPANGKVQAEKGSGVSFGVTILTEELVKCSAQLIVNKGYPGSYKRMISMLAEYLYITEDILIAFLRSPNVALLSVKNAQGREALLLESNFAFSDGLLLNVKSQNKKIEKESINTEVIRVRSMLDFLDPNNPLQYINPTESSQPDIASFIKKLGAESTREASCAQHLNSLRIRVRMADDNESEVPFKLGPNLFVQTTGITLSKIEKAGEEGILDIYVVRFNPSAEGASTDQKSYVGIAETKDTSKPILTENYEDAVPPVALFHQ